MLYILQILYENKIVNQSMKYKLQTDPSIAYLLTGDMYSKAFTHPPTPELQAGSSPALCPGSVTLGEPLPLPWPQFPALYSGLIIAHPLRVAMGPPGWGQRSAWG